ncbi:hypothetical protein LguiB_008224 [Lonicera macranthoides]
MAPPGLLINFHRVYGILCSSVKVRGRLCNLESSVVEGLCGFCCINTRVGFFI